MDNPTYLTSEFLIRIEYSFAEGLNFVLVNHETGEVVKTSRDLPSLIKAINNIFNAYLASHAPF